MVGKELRLISYNIQNGIYEDAIARNIKEMQKSGATIFCLQEARQLRTSFIGNRLERELSEEWESEYYLGDDNRGIDLGLAILWNSNVLRLQELEKISLPKLTGLNFFERQIASSDQPPQRGATIATFNIDNEPLRVSNIHLDWQGGASHRMSQMQYLISYLKQKPPVDHEIICGDFNTTGRQLSARKQQEEIEKILGEGFTEVFPDLKWTSDGVSIDPQRGFSDIQRLLIRLGIRFHQRLDYIFVKGLQVVDAKMTEVEGSDHFPLIVTFRLK